MPAYVCGPVFQAELLRTSRRRRYYFLRVVYGLILLLLLSTRFEQVQMAALMQGQNLRIAMFAELARTTFLAFTELQLIILLLIVPAVVGGAIADEKQRKTLHYIMASRLSSGEIILDKLGARLLNVGVFVLLGLPVVCLLNLMGGIPWEYVVIAYPATFAYIFFAASLAVFSSTLARRVRQAVLLTYLLEAAWLFLPVLAIILTALFAHDRISPQTWINAFQTWLPVACPLLLWEMTFHFVGLAPGFMMKPPMLVEPYVWSMALHFGLGTVLLLYSVVRLRPIFRKQEGDTTRYSWFRARRRRPRVLERPPCGTDAMLWKERYFTRTDVFTKLVVLPATIIFTVVMILGSGIDESISRAIADGQLLGFSTWRSWGETMNEQLRSIAPYYLGLWILAVAGATASSVTVERERDTWTSLTSTPLTAWEIVRGKLLGAIWGLRGFGVLLGLFWVIALAIGGLHPVGFLLALGMLAVVTSFVAALGLNNSLKARNSSRALVSTLVTVFLLNGGFLLLLAPFEGFWTGRQRLVLFHMVPSPRLITMSLLSWGQFAHHRATILGQSPGESPWGPILGYLVPLSIYASAAALMTCRIVRRFDRVLDRPRLADEPSETLPPPVKPGKEADRTLAEVAS